MLTFAVRCTCVKNVRSVAIIDIEGELQTFSTVAKVTGFVGGSCHSECKHPAQGVVRRFVGNLRVTSSQGSWNVTYQVVLVHARILMKGDVNPLAHRAAAEPVPAVKLNYNPEYFPALFTEFVGSYLRTTQRDFWVTYYRASGPGSAVQLTKFFACLERDNGMRRGDDIIARYEAFHKEARASYERAADSPQKEEASLEFRLADAAEQSGNEVDWLLATYRGIRALQ